MAKEEEHSGCTAEKALQEMGTSLSLPGEGWGRRLERGTKAEEVCPCTWKSLPHLPYAVDSPFPFKTKFKPCNSGFFLPLLLVSQPCSR